MTAQYCYVRDEHYLVSEEGRIEIIDEFTVRTMADRKWQHGLHQAIEAKQSVSIYLR